MTPNVLIATRSFGSTSPKPLEILHGAGCGLVTADMSLEMTEERLIDLLKGVAAAIVGVVPLTAHVLENASDLKVVSAEDAKLYQELYLVYKALYSALGPSFDKIANLYPLVP